MTLEQAKIKADERFKRWSTLGERDWVTCFYAGYLQAYDDLKAEMCKVPWTEEDIEAAYNDPAFKDEQSIGFENGIDWAEKRIKERG